MTICEVTILMPCLNEAETIATCIHQANDFLTTENLHGEILIADNGSNDDSANIATSLGARVISVAKRGYGAALLAGIAAAQGRFIIMGDADASYDFKNLSAFLQKLRDGYDLVMGNRFQGGIAAGAMPFLNRYLGNPVLSSLGRLFFRNHIGDFHCGLRGFRRDAILQLNLQGDGMEFASEMIIKATLHELNITEVPTRLFQDGRSRPPHLRPWRDGWRHLRLLLLFSPRWLFLYPGALLLMVGLLLMSLLVWTPLQVGHVRLDIHTLLFSGFFVILGVQAVSFGITIKWWHKLTHFTLERGLLLGLCLIFLSSIGVGYGFWYWQHLSFGSLAPTQMMRILIPAITFFIVGVQIIFSSFFLSFLNLHVRDAKSHYD